MCSILGGAEAVRDFHAVALLPICADFFRQGFAGGNTAADFHFRFRRRVRAVEERGIECRHRVEHRDRMLAQQRRDAIRRRPLAEQHRGRTSRQREGHGIAEAVGEKQFRHPIDHVALRDCRRPGVAVEIGGEFQAGMHMHRALRLAGGARGVEPERNVVGHGRRSVRFRFVGADDVVEQPVPFASNFCGLSPETMTCSRSGLSPIGFSNLGNTALPTPPNIWRGCRPA